MTDHDAALREGLAQELHRLDHQIHVGWNETSDYWQSQYLQRADAVLAYLTEAGVLLPPLPEDAREARAWSNKDGTQWWAIVMHKYDDYDYPKWVSATGQPTLAAAIADALRGVTNDEVAEGQLPVNGAQAERGVDGVQPEGVETAEAATGREQDRPCGY